ncbi:hypothetical protein P4V43_01745 [Brevibacillus fortis]|uniref:hypothetical protein n=1 Tax=Brevibacillus fortis TaxID=2126352 RepID=UPI002E1EF1CA|nr:hypothetical protein [Brevibacillus fortis]
MDDSMKKENEMVKQRDRCEDSVWQGNIDFYCDNCRLAENGRYFDPNMFLRRIRVDLNKPIIMYLMI